MTLSARASGFLLRLTPKGTISLPAIRSWEEESFVAAGDVRLVGVALEANRASLYRGEMGSKDQDLSIMALVTIDDRMT